MSKIQAISDGLGGYIYPVTIADAIIDPETGEPITLGGSDVAYTINDISADSNGNFTITAADLGAAVTGHTHAIADVTGLSASLEGKAVTGHTHTMVTGIAVGGSTVTGDVQMLGTGNVVITQNGSNLVISITPYSADMSSTIVDGNTNCVAAISVFTGTQAEWDEFKTNIAEGERYLVFIHS
jgi:hypothetical protein